MKRKRLLPFAVLLLVAAMVAAGAWAWMLRPVAVQVVETAQDVPIQVFGLGTVEAQILSHLGFETAGTLVALRADHGDSVKADTVLAWLDSREQEARVAQARTAVKQAEAAIEQAMANVERRTRCSRKRR
jgi:HlyD family secretion protein